MNSLNNRSSLPKSSSLPPHQLAEFIGHFIDQRFVLALDHDPDDRLGAGGSDEDAAGATEFFFELADGFGEILG